MRSESWVLALVLALMVASTTRAADTPVPWRDLSDQERTILEPFRDKWEGLPAERQRNLRKGAALNSVQIAAILVREYLA